jgi:hypothetical protein
MSDILFRVGITTCELCDHEAFKRDEDMGYLLCKRCYNFYNGAVEEIELNEEF